MKINPNISSIDLPSIDNVANTDFPEELYWQLELKEYDVKIDTLKRQLAKYNTALTCLARAANLSEAALMAFLGFPDAAYKVWRVEYALKATQRMRLCRLCIMLERKRRRAGKDRRLSWNIPSFRCILRFIDLFLRDIFTFRFHRSFYLSP